MSDERARLFVALELPPDVRAGLSGWTCERVGDVAHMRVVDPEALHVTLCFLGMREVSEVGEIAAVCREATAGLPAASLTVGEALWLPPRRPRVLTVRLDAENGRLAAIQSALAHALGKAGVYEPESRPFLAHVTVARVQRDARPRRLELPAPEPVQFVSTYVTLYRSRLGKGPARYEALARVTLS